MGRDGKRRSGEGICWRWRVRGGVRGALQEGGKGLEVRGLGREEGGGPQSGKGLRIKSALQFGIQSPPAKPGLKISILRAHPSVQPSLRRAPRPWGQAAASLLPLAGSEGS